MYAEADHLLAKLNLRFKSDKRWANFLYRRSAEMVGNRQSAELRIKVIIMDEPTDALTDTETDSLFRVIRN